MTTNKLAQKLLYFVFLSAFVGVSLFYAVGKTQLKVAIQSEINE